MKKVFHLFVLLLFLLVFSTSSVRADVAPPENPPGSNLDPGSASTQVRMVAETVTLTVSPDPADKENAIAKTEAVFTMRNLGAVEEKMNARFPLSFFNGNSDGFGNFPEIASIAVKVNGKAVSTRREMQSAFDSEFSYDERDEIPWAVFEVTFPPNQDVLIEVVYNVNGYGYYPYEAFNYVLETGAGWNGTIGSAEIILRLPYEANPKNVVMEDAETGYGGSTSGGVFSGNEVRWTFTDFEPTYANNLQFVALTPSLWESVLAETENVTRNPKDGEAWGRLGKTYKEIIRMPKGYLRPDSAAVEMFGLSKDAYEKCLALLPNDSLWHYGYADLLWTRYYWEIRPSQKNDSEGILPTVLAHLQTALELDPNNQPAKDLLLEISYSVPEAVQQNADESFTLLGLTATPLPPTPWPEQPTLTFVPSETPPPTATLTTGVLPSNTPTPPASTPLCGSAFLLPIFFGLVFLHRKRK
ncbi:MAG: hypothetical protein IT310_10275 [Anaerolineales bacterium]|nr:hypothetical protein [Anaerolineales bacterium]